MSASLPRVDAGERCMIIGRTGSGKTTGAAWLLSRSPGAWVVLNSKYDPLLARCGPSVPWRAADVLRASRDARIVVAHPDTYDAGELDSELMHLCESRVCIGVLIDELAYLHGTDGRAGPGLMGLLTRGRARGQSFIGCSQRPAAISQFCFSECDHFAIYRLTLPQDFTKLVAISGREALRKRRAPYYWGWYSVAPDTLIEYAPVPAEDLPRRFAAP